MRDYTTYLLSTEYLLCTESPHFATSRSSAQFRKLSWVPWRLQYTTLSGEAVPLLTVVSDWHTNILLASIICHLDFELEHGWITNNKYVSGLFFIQVASHQEWYLDHEVPLQLAGLGPDLDVVPHLHHEQAPLPHQHRGRQPGVGEEILKINFISRSKSKEKSNNRDQITQSPACPLISPPTYLLSCRCAAWVCSFTGSETATQCVPGEQAGTRLTVLWNTSTLPGASSTSATSFCGILTIIL